VAEAYQALGHTEAALMVYKRAAIEGALNPNVRPRAEDLASTCCSMAESGAEPDGGLWEKLAEIQAGLGASSIARTQVNADLGALAKAALAALGVRGGLDAKPIQR
jgi:hypothetical protein